jgi:hypothetical protein
MLFKRASAGSVPLACYTLVVNVTDAIRKGSYKAAKLSHYHAATSRIL